MVLRGIHIFDQLLLQVYGIHEFAFDTHTTIQNINFILIDNYIELERMQSIFDEQPTETFEVLIERDDMQCPNVYLKDENEHYKILLTTTI
jgi:hypothetical protein